MSDPQTNPEIEDVLSSVRRLVSSGKRDDAPTSITQAIEPAGPPGRLLLTPALRVTEPKDLVGWPKDTVEEVVQTQPNVPQHFRSTRDSLEATIAELEAAVIAQPDEWEPDGSEVTTVPTWETVSYPPLDEIEDAEAIAETTPDEMRGEAALAALLAGGPIILEEEEFSDDDPVIAHDGDVIGLTFTRTQPIPEPISEPNIATDEDEDYGDDLSPDTSMVEDDNLDGLLTEDGQIIDEEALRVLVHDIVREELQGKLGERITRNVRKMVRREVHRALDMQGFD